MPSIVDSILEMAAYAPRRCKSPAISPKCTRFSLIRYHLLIEDHHRSPKDQRPDLDALPFPSTLGTPRVHKRGMRHSSTLLAIVTL